MLVTAILAASLFALAVVASIAMERQVKANAEKAPVIAVLPFENVGRKEGQEFADGMTEEITNRLSSLRGLRVIGRQSAKSYEGGNKPPQEIASELGVKYVLTGTVRWDQSREGKVLVRVSSALLRPDDATQLWGEAYQTALSGMFEVPAKVATEVANALKVTLLPLEREALATRPTKNIKAYGLYLNGKEILETTASPERIREAIGYLEKATALDRNFLPAWAALSIAYTEYFWFRGDATPHRLVMAKTALDRAAKLDPESPDVHIARGIFLFHGQRDYNGALREFGLAEQSRPNDYDIAIYKGSVQRRQGKWEEAAQSFKRALAFEPRGEEFALEVAETLRRMRSFDEAEKYADRALQLDPGAPDAVRIKSDIAVDARGNVPSAIEHLRNGVMTVKPHSGLVSLLQQETWPAVEDPSLRQMLIDARRTSDIPSGSFYFHKMRLYLYLSDQARVHAYADSAIPALQRETVSNPDAATAYISLAFVYAVLGNRVEALRGISRSERLLPGTRDMYIAAERLNSMPAIHLLLGEKDAAIAAIEARVDAPAGMTRNRVRLDPLYAPLRGSPRFERLIATQ